MNGRSERGDVRGEGARSRGVWLAAALLGLTTFSASLSAQATRAERSNYAQTSSHADVIAFLDSLVKLAPGRPIVYVQGNIHGGEVEGKEALQALLRDLVLDPTRNALDSIVLLAVPIYNADGNEVWGPQEQQRSEQDGPALVGQRPNGSQLDLNRDYIKNETPETAASLAMFRSWDPDVFVDLHTTNGSYHGYALTYAPSLHPAAMLGGFAPAGGSDRAREGRLGDVRAQAAIRDQLLRTARPGERAE